ncbi:hypothetical protein C8R44DRAFT_237778 [Mycena epipterygia]|nr:hypothetical protein C8R44DRAFT_237778 [Mycena epipterygia]
MATSPYRVSRGRQLLPRFPAKPHILNSPSHTTADSPRCADVLLRDGYLALSGFSRAPTTSRQSKARFPAKPISRPSTRPPTVSCVAQRAHSILRHPTRSRDCNCCADLDARTSVAGGWLPRPVGLLEGGNYFRAFQPRPYPDPPFHTIVDVSCVARCSHNILRRPNRLRTPPQTSMRGCAAGRWLPHMSRFPRNRWRARRFPIRPMSPTRPSSRPSAVSCFLWLRVRSAGLYARTRQVGLPAAENYCS